MGNMGTIPATGYESSVVQTFSSPTGTSHTMTYAANVSDVVLVINNVIQEPTVAFTTSGTTLTTATLVSGDTMYIIYLALSRQTVAPGADTVTNAMIVDNAINSEHYTDGSIDLAHMSANSVDSDTYVDGSIDLAHMSSQSVDEDNLHISNAGSNGEFLSKQSGDAGGLTWAAAGGGFTTGTEQVTTSGSSVTFTGISAGVSKVFISFYAVSLNGSDNIKIQLGDSGGIETGSYLSNSHDFGGSSSTLDGFEFTDSFCLPIGGAGHTVTGNVILSLQDASNHTWIASGNGGTSGGPNLWLLNGWINNLDSDLTQIKIFPSGSNAFDAGAVNISYI